MQSDCEKLTKDLKTLRELSDKLKQCVSSRRAEEALSIKRLLVEKLQVINSDDYIKSVRYKKLITKIFGEDIMDKSDTRIDRDGNIELIRRSIDVTEILATVKETENYLIILKTILRGKGNPLGMRIDKTYAVQVISKPRLRIKMIFLENLKDNTPIVVSCIENASGVEVIVGLSGSEEEKTIFVYHGDDDFKSFGEKLEDIMKRRGRMSI